MPEVEISPEKPKIDAAKLREQVKSHPDFTAFKDDFLSANGHVGIFGIGANGSLVGIRVGEDGTTRAWSLATREVTNATIWNAPVMEPLKGVEIDMAKMDIGPNSVYVFPPRDEKGKYDESLLEYQHQDEDPNISFYRQAGQVTFMVGGKIEETGDAIRKSPNNKIAGYEVIPLDGENESSASEEPSTPNTASLADHRTPDGSYDLKAYYTKIKGEPEKRDRQDIQAAIDADFAKQKAEAEE